MFHIGGEVICINDKCYFCGSVHPQLGLKKGNPYIVDAIVECPSCGTTLLGLGQPLRAGYKGCACDKCENPVSTNTILHDSKRFVPIDYTQVQRVIFKEFEELVPEVALV